MKKIFTALFAILVLASCARTETPIIKKEKINFYEVKDTFGELKKSDVPMMVIIRECNEIGKINKVGFYDAEGKLMFSETFIYNEEGEAIKSSKQTGDYGFLSVTENIFCENGRWFKEENGNKTLLGADYKITGYQYADYIQAREDGTYFLKEPIMGIECDGEINKTDKSGSWIEFTTTTKSVETPKVILERELIELW